MITTTPQSGHGVVLSLSCSNDEKRFQTIASIRRDVFVHHRTVPPGDEESRDTRRFVSPKELSIGSKIYAD